ncbi:hypothetical protein ADL00_11065 [Streptomyces sp. AS58]|uniref:HEAT repeat domain-containing protein n=1 Tax=Streptomyces sp. AS58 TaxID=1519489 RepID=UPI0006AE47B5|nr:HEAT repeat domain-containing protein [Streptomyces sp. AS58]KOV69504.1 hypothetical protein ADL00_11065 [Streptomyces sp. AS58]
MTSGHQIAFFLRELTAPDPGRRAAAAKGLGRIGGAEHTTALAAVAGDAEPEVRAAAAIGLGRLGVREAAEQVLPALMADVDARPRRRAALAAIKLGLDGTAVVTAFARLLRDPDHHVRINALDGLAALGATGDVPALVALFGDPDWAVWGRARTLAWRHRDDPAVRAEVVRTARQGIGAARARALDTLPDRCTESLAESLVEGLRDPSGEVRIQVTRRLSGVTRPGTGEALTAALEAERDPRAAAALLHALERQDDARVAAAAVRWLRDPVAGASAAGVVGAVGSRSAVERLRAVLGDGTMPGRTRAAAAVAVGEWGRWDAVWLLLPLLDDPDADVRTGATDGLGALVDGGLRPWERGAVARALTGRLASGADRVWRTRNALIGLRDALPAVRRLADGSPLTEVRAAALSLLEPARRPDGNARHDVGRFVRALDDPEEPVRYHAALGLGEWIEAGGEPPRDRERVRGRLWALASETSPRLRHAAETALRALDAVPGE